MGRTNLGKLAVVVTGVTVAAAFTAVDGAELKQVSGKRGRVGIQYCPPPSAPYCPPAIQQMPHTAPPAIIDSVPSQVLPTPQPDSSIPVPKSADDSSQTPDSSNTTDATPAPSDQPLPPTIDPNQSPSTNTPSDIQNQFNNAPSFAQSQMNNAVANVGDAGFSGSGAPNMIGDYFGTSTTVFDPLAPGGGGPLSNLFFNESMTGNLAAAPGGTVGRLKLAENTSPLPADRIFVNYSYFNDANILGGVTVNRITPGLETTVFTDDISVEFRVPFADTASSTVYNDGTFRQSVTELGNASLWLKALLSGNETIAVSAGVGVTLPTADDYRILDPFTGQTVLQVANKSPHILPYVATVYTPSDRAFIQTMTQFDIDSGGNPVYYDDFGGGGLVQIARPKDNNYLFVDVQAGYWVYKNPCRNARLQGLAPFLEYHYNETLNQGSEITNGIDLPAPGETHVANGVVGLTARMAGGKSFTIGYATPLGGDRQFDGELRLAFNWIPGSGGGCLSR
ncbi:MAG: hypothetical protein KDA89_17535 [Planctomycetaceae bacterium]|nr:hypothetical protein [Planctomycetaceae bacterium]